MDKIDFLLETIDFIKRSKESREDASRIIDWIKEDLGEVKEVCCVTDELCKREIGEVEIDLEQAKLNLREFYGDERYIASATISFMNWLSDAKRHLLTALSYCGD